MKTMHFQDVISRLEQTNGLLQDNWCVPRETGRFLHVIALGLKAKAILEVGTSIGYSTLWLAQAAARNGGRVDTLEYFEARQQQAIANVKDAGLENTVHFHTGQAIDLLTRMQTQGRSFDLAFIDAAKQEYIDYAQLLQAMMPAGSCLIADNTRSHRKEMLDFLNYMEHSSDWTVAELETPNGQLIAYRN